MSELNNQDLKVELLARMDQQKTQLLESMNQQKTELLGRMDQQKTELLEHTDQMEKRLLHHMDQMATSIMTTVLARIEQGEHTFRSEIRKWAVPYRSRMRSVEMTAYDAAERSNPSKNASAGSKSATPQAKPNRTAS